MLMMKNFSLLVNATIKNVLKRLAFYETELKTNNELEGNTM